MVRRVLGLTVLVIVAWLALKAVGLVVTVLVFAGVGYLCYVVLRAFNPSLAQRVRAAITGHPSTVL